MLKTKGLSLLALLALLTITVTGCSTLTPVAYTFESESGATASISFKTGDPGVTLVYYNDNALPEAEEGTTWNPVSFPAGEPLSLTVHAYYTQTSSSTSLLVTLAAAAISSSRTVDQDVLFECPPLEAGREYELSFRKGAGLTGKNLLVLVDIATNKIVFQQEFQTV